MLNGWIKIHRKLIDHWLFKEHRPKTKLEAWLIILLECNHYDSKVLINGTLIDCKTGQSVRSIATWSKEFKWTYAKVRSFFKLLEKDNMIVLEGFANTTRLSICNYDSYQKTKQTDDKQETSEEQTENNKQECKEEKAQKRIGKVYSVCGHFIYHISIIDYLQAFQLYKKLEFHKI